MECLGTVVRRSKAEKLKKTLLQGHMLNKDLRPIHRGEVVIFPLNQEGEWGSVISDMEVEQGVFDFEERATRPERGYRALLEGKVPKKVADTAPRAMDVLGDIAVVKIPSETEEYKEEVAGAILEYHPRLRAVFNDRGVKGRERKRELEHIGGEKKTHTVYREWGLSYHLDVANVYFSPRLATERMRVALALDRGERVLDMFAGVGPFSILIAKKTGSRVTAIDINPLAVNLLRRNVEENGVSGLLTPVLGDAGRVVPGLSEDGFDAVVMNLPRGAREFIDTAVGACAPGGKIFYYEICPDDSIQQVIKELGSEEIKVKDCHRVHNYSPEEAMYSFLLDKET